VNNIPTKRKREREREREREIGTMPNAPVYQDDEKLISHKHTVASFQVHFQK